MTNVLVESPLTGGHPPKGIAAWGEDRAFGAWIEIRVGEARQRMRWVPPGEFWMGSPDEGTGRDIDEARHEVRLTRGFWLADTPCTQAFWKAVTGNNPSRFQSSDRPVEQVTFEEVLGFLEKLSSSVSGRSFRLPTEAEWERACRAGTVTATYGGDLEILGQRNAPVLDEIAWYGGNSGVDFELENGWDTSDWEHKQYEHNRAGTHPVKQKRPNALGLYDMLGNVWEWCSDRWARDLGRELAIDPRGLDEGSRRVIRGGSWYVYAQSVRAAFRDGRVPDYRGDDLGFRFARGQE